MATDLQPTAEQIARERAIFLGMKLDFFISTAMTISAIAGGSLTLLAESMRGWMMQAIEAAAYMVLRRIHRGQFVSFNYGAGKLEQLINLAIAIGLCISAVGIGTSASVRLLEPPAPPHPLGLGVAAVVGAINVWVNITSWDALRRSAAGTSSVIVLAQLRSRTARLIVSMIAQMFMTICALASDRVVVAWCDGIGTMIIVVFMLWVAAGMFRHGLPDMLDRSIEESAQRQIVRALAEHFESYAELGRIRTRRSGGVTFVEIDLGFDPELAMAEISRRIDRLRLALTAAVPEADVSIVAGAVAIRP